MYVKTIDLADYNIIVRQMWIIYVFEANYYFLLMAFITDPKNDQNELQRYWLSDL